MGLLLRMSAPLHEFRKRVHNTQTSPPDQKVPRIVSRLHTLENESKICHQAFPPGEHLVIPPLPNVTAVNTLGDFSIAKDRLAIIDGEGTSASPWFRISHSPSIPLCTAIFPTPISSAHDTLHPLPSPVIAPFFLDPYAPIPLVFPSKFPGPYFLLPYSP